MYLRVGEVARRRRLEAEEGRLSAASDVVSPAPMMSRLDDPSSSRAGRSPAVAAPDPSSGRRRRGAMQRRRKASRGSVPFQARGRTADGARGHPRTWPPGAPTAEAAAGKSLLRWRDDAPACLGNRTGASPAERRRRGPLPLAGTGSGSQAGVALCHGVAPAPRTGAATGSPARRKRRSAGHVDGAIQPWPARAARRSRPHPSSIVGIRADPPPRLRASGTRAVRRPRSGASARPDPVPF